jgi:hypothetical protein
MDIILSTKINGENLTIKHQQRLRAFLNRIRHGDYKHKFQNVYSAFDGDALSLHSTEMEKMFRKKSDNGYYKKVLNAFFECIDETYSFGNGKGLTKAYILKK